MKKKNALTMLGTLLFIALSGFKCDKPPFAEEFFPITVQNNSPDTIYADLGLGIKHPFPQFPDTILPTDKPVLMYILPYSSSYHFDFRKPQEQIVKELAADTLSIYIFSKSVYEDTAWSNVRSGYQVLQRYDLSLENLQRLDFKVPYPPTTEMAGMKIYP